MPVKKKVPTKPAAAPTKESKKVPTINHLFAARPKNLRVGGDVMILLERLKVPPVINQFTKAVDKNQAAELMKLLVKYQPETKAAKAVRIEALAKATASGENVARGPAPNVIKYGLNHVTTLIEQKKAKLVIIAHDVDPIELVVWLPGLCRKMDVPFCIVKGKGRLGTLVHKKKTAVLALTNVNKEDENKLASLVETYHKQFNETVERKWGGGVMGLKTTAKLEKRRKQIEAEEKKKAEAAERSRR